MSELGQGTHPAGEVLEAFALGRLDDGNDTLVADHLGVCETCLQAVLDVPDDSMVSALRPVDGAAPTVTAAFEADLGAFEDGLPPELRDHPRYRLLREIGSGGMGVVYEAEHRLLERHVALKVINKQLTASPGVVERFRREMRAVARLSHPNLVQAHDAEREGDLHFLVMEFVEGENLAWLVKDQGPLAIEQACDCVRQAATGLAHALSRGLVHRDVKPQNMILTPIGQVKLLDFGLASIAEDSDGDGLTETGQRMGTPDYMAPEQVREAHSADSRADVYSLGCTLYFLLSGRPPFPGPGSSRKMAAHLEMRPVGLRELRPEVPAGLEKVIERMMEKDRALRYQTPEDVVAALEPWCGGREEWGQHPKPEAPERVPWGAVAVLAAFLLVVVAVTLAWIVPRLLDSRQFASPPSGWRDTSKPAKPAPKWPELKAGDPAPDLSRVIPVFGGEPRAIHFPRGHQKDIGADWRVEDDRLVILNPANSCWNVLGSAAGGDFAFLLRGRVGPNCPGSWVVGLFTNTPDPSPCIRLSRDGVMEVFDCDLQGVPEVQRPLIKPIEHTPVEGGDEFNSLLVVVRGGERLEVYVNGVAVCPAIKLARPLGPYVWPVIMTWGRRAEFERCALWLLSSPPSLAESKGTHPSDLDQLRPDIDDDFSAPDRIVLNMGRDEKNWNRKFIDAGRYVIQHDDFPHNWLWSEHRAFAIAQASCRRDVAIRVVGQVVSEGDNGWDLRFVSPSLDRSLAVRLRRDGAVEVADEFNPGGSGIVAGPIRHPAILPGEKENTLLAILRDGQNLEVYVNGEAICAPIRLRERLETVMPGVGLWERCTSPEPKGRAEFSRFTVWRLSK